MSPEGTANLLEWGVELIDFPEDYVVRQELGRILQTLRDTGDRFAGAGDDPVWCDDSEAPIVLGHHDVVLRRQVIQRGVLLLECSALLAQCLGCKVKFVCHWDSLAWVLAGMDSPLNDLECFAGWRVRLELVSKAGVQFSLLVVAK